MSEELKPCPLCGGEIITIETHPGRGEIYCVSCDLVLGGDNAMTPDELTEKWNTRTTDQAIAATLGAGECEVECFDDGVDEGMDGEWYSYAPPTWYLSCGHDVQGTERPNFCVVCGKAVKR